MIESEKELLEYVTSRSEDYDAIVVEGYDGVGKGRVLNILSQSLGVTPYRPDYSLWQKYDLRPEDRWKISGFFWDIISHFNIHPINSIMLFDRGVLSGSVYNDDDRISQDYPNLLKGMKVLHIYVTCTLEDYRRFQEVRGVTNTDLIKFLEYEGRYSKSLVDSNSEFIVYKNRFDEALANEFSITCEGCGHYSYGICRHPLIDGPVEPKNNRCKYTKDKEVQDLDR